MIPAPVAGIMILLVFKAFSVSTPYDSDIQQETEVLCSDYYKGVSGLKSDIQGIYNLTTTIFVITHS
jgi:hypothetical protein